MITINDVHDYRNAMATMQALHALRATRTFAQRPDVENTPWIKTVWANENYL